MSNLSAYLMYTDETCSSLSLSILREQLEEKML
jgi:hypothetical protein